MAAQLADAELIDRRIIHEMVGDAPVAYGSDTVEDNDRTTAVRGIATAVLISTPFWALIAFTIYLLA
jgi:hypothetical protein